jgi:hypothetical protein
VEVGASAAPALVIEPGCRLAFGPDAGLAIGRGEPGMLTAVGLPDSIVFTGTRAAPGSWRGVELHSNADNRSRLERCRLLYGGGAGTGILFVDSCLPVIRGNELGWSGSYCAYLWNTDLNPDSLLALNWLHDPAPGYDTVFDGGRRR